MDRRLGRSFVTESSRARKDYHFVDWLGYAADIVAKDRVQSSSSSLVGGCIEVLSVVPSLNPAACQREIERGREKMGHSFVPTTPPPSRRNLHCRAGLNLKLGNDNVEIAMC